MLPFTTEQFFTAFSDYNAAIWPAQLLFHGLGLAIVLAVLLRWRHAGRIVSAGLAAMWAWTGLGYHYGFFARINDAAVLFAVVFVVQALMLVYQGLARNRLQPVPWPGLRGAVGWALIAYAAIAYPLIGVAGGHRFGELPQFGVTPCPVTLFTFGMLLLMRKPVPWSVFAIPFAWSLIGGSAAFLLGVPQDWPLLASGFVSTLIMWRSKT